LKNRSALDVANDGGVSRFTPTFVGAGVNFPW
jgi:hypothetical protein